MPINNTEKNFPRRKITFGEIKFDVSLYIITRAELTPLYTQPDHGYTGKNCQVKLLKLMLSFHEPSSLTLKDSVAV